MTTVADIAFSLECRDLLRARAIAGEFDAHLHSRHSIVVVKRGRAELKSKRWSGSVKAGDVFFFNPYEVHAGSAGEHGVEYEVLYPATHILEDSLQMPEGCDSIMIRTGVMRRSACTEELEYVLSSSKLDQAALGSALRNVMARCEVVSLKPTRPRSLTEKVTQILKRDYHRRLRTGELAAKVGVHKSHLIRAFKAVTGLPPETFLRQLRIAEAQELIYKGKPLSEVAYFLGFCDQAHFSREFKKVFGVSPGKLPRIR